MKRLKALQKGRYQYQGKGIIAYRPKEGAVIYGIRWRERGRYVQKMVGTSKTEAVDMLTRKKAKELEKDLGLAVRDDREVITLAEYAPDYLKRHETKRSANRDERGVRKVLLKHLSNKPLSEICQLDVERIRQARRNEGCSNATINRDVALLRHMLNRAVKLGYIEYNPIAKVDKLEEPPFDPYIFTASEVDAVVANAPPNIRHMITLAIGLGVRSGELVTLDWESIDLVRGVITIRTEHSKGGKGRYLVFGDNPSVVEALRALRPPGVRPEGPVFRTAKGTRYRWYQGDWKKALKRAGVPTTARFHDLRHTFGTMAAEAVPGAQVQQAMGHSSYATTQKYIHMTGEASRGPIAALSKWREGGRNVLDGVSEEDAAADDSSS
jgi:integrase